MIHKKKKFVQLYERAQEIKKSNHVNQKKISPDEVEKIIDDYSLYQIELELQNEELQKALVHYEEERSRYSELYEFIPLGYFALSSSGLILEANEFGARLLGFRKGNIINKNLSRYIAPNYQHLYLDHIQQVLNSTCKKSCELKIVRKNGPLFSARLDAKAVINPLTRQTYLIMFVEDLSDKKPVDHHLHECQQKIASTENAIEEFAEIVTHELNHPLGVITNYLHGCVMRLENDSFQKQDIIHALKQAYNQSHRITEVILRMKKFTCKGEMLYEKVDINELINEAISLINYETSPVYPVRIIYYPLRSSLEINLDKIHIEQVIINIARNAIEAMFDANVSEPKLVIETSQIKTNQIQISITDNGPSIQEDHVHQVFNPYFTTKSYGVGLGLAVCKKIIEAHGGRLSVEIPSLGGACFKFSLVTNLNEIALEKIDKTTNQIDKSGQHDLIMILSEIQKKTGFDFSSYKLSVLKKCIDRQMVINKIPTYLDYLTFLHADPNNTRTLSETILIGVTRFFRDQESFHALKKT